MKTKISVDETNVTSVMLTPETEAEKFIISQINLCMAKIRAAKDGEDSNILTIILEPR